MDNENVKIVNDINKLESYINSEEENFVIGGAIVYRQLMPKADKMYITRIYEKIDGDTYFLVIDENEWTMTKKLQE